MKRRRAFTLLFSVVLGTAGALASGGAAKAACGDQGDASTAVLIEGGTTIESDFCAGGEVDWYRFSAINGNEYTVFVAPSSEVDAFMFLYDSSVTFVTGANSGGPGASESLTFTASYTGIYYYSLTDTTSVGGPYSTTLTGTTGEDTGGGGTSHSATQTTSVVVPAEEGVLTVNVAQASVAFGAVPAGSSSGPKSVGDIAYTNTLPGSNPWNASVAATDLVSGANRIDFTNITFAPGSAIDPATGGITTGSAGSFSGGDPEAYSGPLPLVNADSTVADGTFTQSGSTAQLTVPGGTSSASDYQGTLQYTIFG